MEMLLAHTQNQKNPHKTKPNPNQHHCCHLIVRFLDLRLPLPNRKILQAHGQPRRCLWMGCAPRYSFLSHAKHISVGYSYPRGWL